MSTTTAPAHHVVVVGGGLAGLLCAYELRRHGIEPVVLERGERLGGRIRTITFPDGTIAEAGMEEFWTGGPVLPVMRALGLPLSVDTAHSSVVIDGELCVYQGDGDRDTYLSGIFDAGEIADYLEWDAAATSILRQLDADPSSATRGDHPIAMLRRTSFAAHVGATVRHPRVASWIRVVVEAESSTAWDRISALDGIAEMRTFLDTPTGFGQDNVRVLGGNEQLVRALADELADGAVQLGTRVTRIRHAGAHVVVESVDRSGRTRELRADHAVVTVPMWALADIAIEPGLDARLRAAVTTLESASYVKVVLKLRPEAEGELARFGPRLFTLLTDAMPGCLYLRRGAAGHDVVLTALVHGRHARRLADAGPADCRAAVVDALARLRVTAGSRRSTALLPGVARHVVDARVAAWPRAIAHWPFDRGRSRFDERSITLRAPSDRIHIGGDTVHGTHTDGAAASALGIAARIHGSAGAAAIVAG